MKKLLTITLLLLNLILNAQGIENSGLTFLRLGLSARQLALGNLGVSEAKETEAIFYNPSLLYDSSGKYLSVSHHRIMQDVNSETVSSVFSIIGLPIGIAINTTSIQNIEIRTKAGAPQGYFSAHYFFATIATGFKINKFVNVGFSVKYLYEGLFVDESTGYAVDIGINTTQLIKKLKIGFALKNLGSMNTLRAKPTKLPTSITFGASYLLNIPNFDFQILPIVGIEKLPNENVTHFTGGAEISYRNKLFFRLGYLTGYEAKSFSAGLGFNFSIFKFDYAFVPNKYNLGDSHFLTLTVNVSNIF